MWYGSQYASVTQRSEYVRMCLDRVSSEYILSSKYAQDSEYGRVLKMQELHRVLNMPEYG